MGLGEGIPCEDRTTFDQCYATMQSDSARHSLHDRPVSDARFADLSPFDGHFPRSDEEHNIHTLPDSGFSLHQYSPRVSICDYGFVLAIGKHWHIPVDTL